VNDLVDAVVFASPAEAARPVAGMPHLLRTLLCLQRAGIRRCVVAGGASVPEDERLRTMAVSAETNPSLDGADPRLVVEHGTIVDTVLVTALRLAVKAGEAVDVDRDGARVHVAGGRAHKGRAVTGPPPLMGTLRRLDDPPADVEMALLEGLENHRDGYLDGLLNRRLSRPLTRRLLSTSLSPNAVTGIGIALGVAGGLSLGLPWPAGAVLAVVLLVCSSVLDCVDGELARIRFAESKLGHTLDITGDTVVHLALFAGIALTLGRTGAFPDRATLILLVTGILGAFAAITWSEINEGRRHRVWCWENRVLDGVLSPLTTRDWYVFPLVFALIGRLDWMVHAAAIGAHVFWVVVVVLVARVLRRA
jgi:phosphatidylglycerophosphate synthase